MTTAPDTDRMAYCQGARYNAACPAGSRVCREYGGLWLCLNKCWRHRQTIAVLAGVNIQRKEALAGLRNRSTVGAK
jgi:hypothetical protein